MYYYLDILTAFTIICFYVDLNPCPKVSRKPGTKVNKNGFP